MRHLVKPVLCLVLLATMAGCATLPPPAPPLDTQPIGAPPPPPPLDTQPIGAPPPPPPPNSGS